MNTDEARDKVVAHWHTLAKEALESARSELAAGRFAFALNRCYYACFYPASAVLLREGQRFSKHSGVRAAVHQHLVKAGRLEARFGIAFDQLFESRNAGDYEALVTFERASVEDSLRLAQGVLAELERLLADD